MNPSELARSNGVLLNRVQGQDPLEILVTGGGDINGDGINDLIFGERFHAGLVDFGYTHVVFGSSGDFDANRRVNIGHRVSPHDPYEGPGNFLSSVGDINGDGFDDLIISDYVLLGSADGFNQHIKVRASERPQLDLNGNGATSNFEVNFALPGVTVPIVNRTNLTLTDIDSTTLQLAKVRIKNLQDVGGEILAADTRGTNITANYDATTGTLTLTGEDTVDSYQKVLRTVTYHNTAPTPTLIDRFIDFSVGDELIKINSTTNPTT